MTNTSAIAATTTSTSAIALLIGPARGSSVIARTESANARATPARKPARRRRTTSPRSTQWPDESRIRRKSCPGTRAARNRRLRARASCHPAPERSARDRARSRRDPLPRLEGAALESPRHPCLSQLWSNMKRKTLAAFLTILSLSTNSPVLAEGDFQLDIGQKARVTQVGSERACYVSQEAMDAFQKANSLDDDFGENEALQGAYKLANGTRVLALSYGDGGSPANYVRLRILSGDHQGDICWFDNSRRKERYFKP
jgi:hypothetical protein